ncbi:MAG TPA: hypothetical protein VIY48_20465 [Candidatus Paceibacterota bacterium]
MTGFILQDRLRETDSRHHDDLVDSVAYMVASLEAKMRDEYACMYIKQKPRWIPKAVYHWLLSKILVMANFRY